MDVKTVNLGVEGMEQLISRSTLEVLKLSLEELESNIVLMRKLRENSVT